MTIQCYYKKALQENLIVALVGGNIHVNVQFEKANENLFLYY
jgi:hypothetical protein